MSQYPLRWGGLASLFCLLSTAIAPVSAQSDVLLTQAEVAAFSNRVELLLEGGPTRPVRDRDRLGFGDTIRTQQASQADLHFNNGGRVRLGELATFWFLPNTRDVRLGQGTALVRLPSGRQLSTLETPNAITEMQGATVVVRYVRPANTSDLPVEPRAAFQVAGGRTAVMVLATEEDDQPVQVSLRNGRSVDLTAGQLAIVDNENLYIFEFDLALFYETSALVQEVAWALPSESNAADPDNPAPTDAESPTSSASDFVGDYWLDPQFLSPDGTATAEGGWLFPTVAPTANPEADADTAAPSAPTANPATTHDTSTIDVELTPPTETADPENRDSNSAVPAGVMPPPASDAAPPESPAPPPTGPPAEDLPAAGDRPAVE